MERLVEGFYRLVGILTKSEQLLNKREEQYNPPRVRANDFGNPRWWNGVDNQDDGANGRPDPVIHLGVSLAKRRLEGQHV